MGGRRGFTGRRGGRRPRRVPHKGCGLAAVPPTYFYFSFFRPSALAPVLRTVGRPCGCCAGAVSGTRRDGIAMSAVCAAPPVHRRLSSGCAHTARGRRERVALGRASPGGRRRPRPPVVPQPPPGRRGTPPHCGSADVNALTPPSPSRSLPVLYCLYCTLYRTVSVWLCESWVFAYSIAEPGRGDTPDCPVSQVRDVLSLSLFCYMFLPITTPSTRYLSICVCTRGRPPRTPPLTVPTSRSARIAPADSLPALFTSPSLSHHHRRACPPLPP